MSCGKAVGTITFQSKHIAGQLTHRPALDRLVAAETMCAHSSGS